jgi:hypothetical protein
VLATKHAGNRILLVEDEATSREIITEVLRGKGYSVDSLTASRSSTHSRASAYIVTGALRRRRSISTRSCSGTRTRRDTQTGGYVRRRAEPAIVAQRNSYRGNARTRAMASGTGAVRARHSRAGEYSPALFVFWHHKNAFERFFGMVRSGS